MKTKHPLHIGFVSFLFLRDWSGAERITATLTEAMLERGHQVTIITQAGGGTPSPSVPVSPLPENAKVLELVLTTPQGQEQARDNLQEADFDIVVAFFGGKDLLWMPWLLKDADIPFLVAECIHPDVMTHERWNPYEHYGTLAAADRIQVLLPAYKNRYPQALQSRITVIGNQSPPPATINEAELLQKKEHMLLGVGRFEDGVKQFSLLLRAWVLLAPEFPQWSLTLVGDGPQWGLYSAMVEAMGPDARVTLTGSVADPSPYYAEASLFCMPSKQESFGLVLTEAASFALPLVGFASCEAAAELISPGSGALAEEDNPASLAETLRSLMAMDTTERLAIGKEAQKSLWERFDAQKIFDEWEQLLETSAEAKGHTQLSELKQNRWNEAILTEAALEIMSRPHPFESINEKDGTGNAAALARLQSKNVARERDFKRLRLKYEGLLTQVASGRSTKAQHSPTKNSSKKRQKKRK